MPFEKKGPNRPDLSISSSGAIRLCVSCGFFDLSSRGHTAMRVIVLRASAAPTDSQGLLDAVGKETHTEVLARTLMNALFVAQSHCADAMVHLVLERKKAYSRTISFDS